MQYILHMYNISSICMLCSVYTCKHLCVVLLIYMLQSLKVCCHFQTGISMVSFHTSSHLHSGCDRIHNVGDAAVRPGICISQGGRICNRIERLLSLLRYVLWSAGPRFC